MPAVEERALKPPDFQPVEAVAQAITPSRRSYWTVLIQVSLFSPWASGVPGFGELPLLNAGEAAASSIVSVKPFLFSQLTAGRRSGGKSRVTFQVACPNSAWLSVVWWN